MSNQNTQMDKASTARHYTQMVIKANALAEAEALYLMVLKSRLHGFPIFAEARTNELRDKIAKTCGMSSEEVQSNFERKAAQEVAKVLAS